MSAWSGADSGQLLATLLFDATDAVVELRALSGSGRPAVTAGYFSSPETFLKAAESLDGRASGIYCTLNPVQPALLARASDRTVVGLRTATSDKDIVARRHLLVDIDAARPSGISATEVERAAAFALAKELDAYLASLGFPAPAKADSGNGAHLIYRVELPSDDDGLVRSVLRALAFRFDNEHAKVDQSVHNSARLCRLYGTLAMKGDDTPERPHRRSLLFSVPPDFRPVPIELLRQVAALAPSAEQRNVGESGRIDVEVLLAAKGIAIAKSGPWSGGTRWVLETCPFNPDHADRSAYVVQFANGALAAGCFHNGCANKGWHELRDLLDPGWRERRGGCGGSVSAAQGASADSWPDPAPLPDELPPVPPFDLGCLPQTVQPYVGDIAERMQCPPEYPAVATMIALAGAVGRKLCIRPKRQDDWSVVPNLWGCGIGRPGLLKTPAIMEPLGGLKRLEVRAKEKFEADQREFAADEIVDKQRRKLAESDVREALQAQDESKLAEAKSRLSQRTNPPTRRRFLVNDSSVEKLGELLNENPNGLVVYRDELTGFLISLDKEGQEGARAFYLEAWDGSGRYTYDRIGRGTIDIEATTVSIIGAIQPGPLRGYLQHALNQTQHDDGLIQRFQLAVWPDASGPWKNVDRWPDSTARNAFHGLVERLADLDPTSVGAQEDEHTLDKPPFLRFAEFAQRRFDAWRAELESRLRSGDDHPAIESHLAKYRSLVPSLALLIHLAEGSKGPVSDSALDKALRWATYLESHARRIYSVAANADVLAAKALTKKILAGAVRDGFTSRDVYRKGWALLADSDTVRRAVELLIDFDWLRVAREPARCASPAHGGAPRTSYLINPAILRQVTAKTDRTSPPGAERGEGAEGRP